MSRRAFLAAAAATGGVLAGLYSSCEPPKAGPATSRPDLSAPPTTATALTAAPASQRAPVATTAPATAESQPVAASGPAPDLGVEVFPDAAGRAIASADDAPVIILPREAWTSAPPNRKQLAVMNGVDKITVHHSAGAVTTDAWASTAKTLEGIRGFHAGTATTDRQWADIAYHFAVDRAGRVWQARPLVYQGAHVRGHNEHNLGIVLLGNFEAQAPTAAQLWSLAAFIEFLRPLYKVPLDQVYTHGELGRTECPGKTLQAFMTRTRRNWATAEGTRWEPRTT
jgi:hypothetical protein